MTLVLYALFMMSLVFMVSNAYVIRSLIRTSALDKKVVRRFLLVSYLAGLIFILLLFDALYSLATQAKLL